MKDINITWIRLELKQKAEKVVQKQVEKKARGKKRRAQKPKFEQGESSNW